MANPTVEIAQKQADKLRRKLAEVDRITGKAIADDQMRKLEPGWFPTKDILPIFGFARSYFDKDVRPLMPESSTLQIGKCLFFRSADIVEVLISRALRGRRGTFAAKLDDGGTLEALKIESLRKKNRIESIKLAELEQKRKLEAGELLSLADVQETLLPAAESLRKLGDQMGRKDTVSGREVQRRINAVVDRIRKAVE